MLGYSSRLYSMAIGISFTLVWLMMGAFSHQIIYAGVISYGGWLVTMTACVVGLACLWLLYPRFGPLILKKPIAWATSLCASAGVACVSLAVNAPATFSGLVLFGDVLSGFGMAFSLLFIKEALSRIGVKAFQELVCFSALAIAVLLYLLLLNVEFIFLLIICSAAPILSMELLRFSFKEDHAFAGENEYRIASVFAKKAVPVRHGILFATVLFVISLPQGVFIVSNTGYQYSHEWMPILASAIMIIVFVVISITLLAAKLKRYAQGRFILAALVLLSTALCLFMRPFATIEGIVQYLCSFLFILYVITEIDALDLSLGLFCGLVVSVVAGVLVGALLVGMFPMALSMPVGVVWVCATAMLLGIRAVFAGDAVYRFGTESNEDEAGRSSATYAEDVSARCQNVRKAFGLSKREAEIMELLIRGRSAQSIAEEKFISYNTVRTHISHIYRKLEVHNREELVVFFEKTNEENFVSQR